MGLSRVCGRAPGLVLAVLLAAGCNGLTPVTISPLAGTWYAVTRNPGVTYTCKLVFDYTGNLENLEITSVNGIQRFTFDGQPHKDEGGDYETATATTTLADDAFSVKAHVERTSGKYKGLTYITVEGTVHYGSMAGTLRVAIPGGDSGTLDFDGSRS